MYLPHKLHEGKTYGNALMYRWLITMLKHCDIRLLYAIMKICVIPFTLIFSSKAKITFQYYKYVRHHGWAKSWWDTYLNHVVFGKTVIDKFSMYAGHKIKIRYRGIESFTRLSRNPKSFLQLSAHIGCSEIFGYSYKSTKPYNVLVYGGENKSLMTYRERAFQKGNIKMIPVGTNISHSEEIIKALDNGEIIHAFADRLTNANRTITTDFKGRQIKVSRGPISIAVTRGLDVIMTNAMKEADNSYTVYFTPLYYDKEAKRCIQLQQLADAYIAEMERLLKLYPLQWFNYANQEKEKQ